MDLRDLDRKGCIVLGVIVEGHGHGLACCHNALPLIGYVQCDLVVGVEGGIHRDRSAEERRESTVDRRSGGVCLQIRIVVDIHIHIVLQISLVVLLNPQLCHILHQHRSVIVTGEGKGKGCFFVTLRIARCRGTDDIDRIGTVIDQSLGSGVQSQFKQTRTASAGIIGLTDVLGSLLIDDLTGHIINNLGVDFRTTAKQSEINIINGIVGILVVGKRRVLHQGCGLFVAVSQVVAVFTDAPVADRGAAVLEGSHRDGGIHIFLELILFQYRAVHLGSADRIGVRIQKRSLCPVAPEGNIRNGQVCSGIAAVQLFKVNEAFDKHTVLEFFIQIGLVRIGQGDLHFHFHGRLTAHRNGIAGQCFSVRPDLDFCIIEHVSVFGNGFAVRRNALGHNIRADTVSTRLRAVVDQVEFQGIYTGFVLIIAKRKLGLSGTVHRDVLERPHHRLNIGKSRSLLTR